MVDFIPQNWSLEKRILATIAYFDVFDLSLSLSEVDKYLLGKRCSWKILREHLDKLCQEGILESKADLFCLKGRRSLFEERESKQLLVSEYCRWIDSKSWIWQHLPWINAVYVCNYLAFKILNEDSDVDLLVVTKENRIFLARTFLTGFLHILGVRRHDRKVRRRFCLSFYVSENRLNMEDLLISNGDIYFIYWLLALIPLKSAQNSVCLNNIWVNNYLPDFSLRVVDVKLKNEDKKGKLAVFFEWIFSGRLGNRLEKYLEKRALERLRVNQKSLSEKASVIVSDQILKFHNVDRRADFKLAWEERLKSLGFSGDLFV